MPLGSVKVEPRPPAKNEDAGDVLGRNDEYVFMGNWLGIAEIDRHSVLGDD